MRGKGWHGSTDVQEAKKETVTTCFRGTGKDQVLRLGLNLTSSGQKLEEKVPAPACGSTQKSPTHRERHYAGNYRHHLTQPSQPSGAAGNVVLPHFTEGETESQVAEVPFLTLNPGLAISGPLAGLSPTHGSLTSCLTQHWKRKRRTKKGPAN